MSNRVAKQVNKLLQGILLAFALGSNAFAESEVAGKQQEHEVASNLPGLFAVYEQNRRLGIPNYITQDFVLLAYSLIREQSLVQQEKQWLAVQAELFPQLLAKLEAANTLAGREDFPRFKEIKQSLRSYLELLSYLARGEEPQAQSPVKSEWQKVMAAEGIEKSPLMGYRLDYSQFTVRGHYADDSQLSRYFRMSRYTGLALFPLDAGEPLGIGTEQENLLAGQALLLSEIIGNDPDLSRTYHEMNQSRLWAYGPSQGVTLKDWREAAEKQATAASFSLDTLRGDLMALARKQGRLETVVSLPIESKKDDVAERLTGWRWLPLASSWQARVFLQLAGPQVGNYNGANVPECQKTPPLSLINVNGESIKGFVLIDELFSLLGTDKKSKQVHSSCDARFDHYAEMYEKAKTLTAGATGLPKLQVELIQGGQVDNHSAIHTDNALKGYWLYQRRLGMLYEAPSYTPKPKSIRIDPERKVASLEPATNLYKTLLLMVESHRKNTPTGSWDTFAVILTKLIELSQQADTPLSEQDMNWLNALDGKLKTELNLKSDNPVVVDVHTDTASEMVQHWGLTSPMLVERAYAEKQAVRGARFRFREWLEADLQRLTDRQWADRLAAENTKKQ